MTFESSFIQTVFILCFIVHHTGQQICSEHWPAGEGMKKAVGPDESHFKSLNFYLAVKIINESK